MAIVEHLLNVPHVSLAFIAVVHLGTLLAILVYFWKDIVGLLKPKSLKDPQSAAWKIALATVPAVFAGLALESVIEDAIQGLAFVAGALFLTGMILLISERIVKAEASKKKTGTAWNEISYADAFLIGIAQVLALIPGISRSGTTMAAGLLRGMKREDAVRFSFLMSIPIVGGAGLFSLYRLLENGNGDISNGALAVGFLVSFLVGLATIHFFLKHVRKQTFRIYGWYAVIVAVAVGGYAILG